MIDLNTHGKMITAAVGSVMAGLGQMLGALPDDIGKISVISGFFLTVAMYRGQIKENQRKDIQIELDKIKLAEAQAAQTHTRRADDEKPPEI